MEGYTFVNWAGTQCSHPELYFEPNSMDEIKEILRKAREEGKRIKVQGSGHSPNDIACSIGYMINLKKMTGIVNVDEEKMQITVQAGCSLKTLAEDILPKYNMALPVCPSAGEPTIAGAICCGTHGSGKKFQVLGSYVTALILLTADGKVLNCSKEENSEIFRAAVCSLGSLGVILEVTLQCHESFQIHSIRKPSTLKEILGGLDSFVDRYDHAKFWWFPHTEKVVVYHDSRIKNQPVKNPSSWFWDRFIGQHLHQFSMWMGCTFPCLQKFVNLMFFNLLFNFTIERTDTSYNVFTFNCLYAHDSTEWSVPLEKAVDVLRELRYTLNLNRDISAHFPVEVRFVKGDDGMISPCHGRDSCLIGIVHYRPYGINTSNKRYWELFQDIVAIAGGRPHWAKAHNVTSKDFSKIYPEWEKFCSIREKLDPDGMFLNDHLERLFEMKKNEAKKNS